MKRALFVTTTVRPAPAGAVATIGLRRQDEEQPRVVVRRLRPGDAAPPAYGALLLALWEARRMSARDVVLTTDDADVAAQLEGSQPPAPGAIGPYLQIRALRHAFTTVEIRYLHADSASEVLKDTPPARIRRRRSYSDLPLWACPAAS